jgi:hypothetical protein
MVVENNPVRRDHIRGHYQTIVSYQDSRFLSTFWSSLWSLLDTKLTNIVTIDPYIAQLDHNPFQVGLGFQPLGPMDVALPLASTQEESSHAQTEADKATRFIE